jgi:alkylation response protein AidB-like acyl-CoA dehydrogenase
MHIAYTRDQDLLREELRSYFAGLLTPEQRADLADSGVEHGSGTIYRDIIRQLGRDGWLGIGWPAKYGGQDRTMIEQAIFVDEATVAGIPVPLLTMNTVGPTIMQYGSEEQKEFFLPRILAGELHFAIGYSESGAGTDLAALTTRAVQSDTDWIINGSKMWTSVIEHADYVWLAARTDPSAPRHRGLSIFLVPTTADGFSYTPVRTLSGMTTSQTYFDDVRIPANSLVGQLNGGWQLMTGQLNRERVALCSPAAMQAALNETRVWADQAILPDGRRVIDQEWVHVNLGRAHAKIEFLKLINWKIAWGVDQGVSPADASATKVFGTELSIEVCRLLMECVGEHAYLREGSPGAVLGGLLERAHREALVLTFGGGTNEIQRDIIATVGLGLPRAPR